MTYLSRTYWQPPSPFYDAHVYYKRWFRQHIEDKEQRIVRVWLTEFQFLNGRTKKASPLWGIRQFPHVSGEELLKKYVCDKPYQARCADCGHVYLWRSKPKLWELACWQIAAPYEAEHPFAQRCLNPEIGFLGVLVFFQRQSGVMLPLYKGFV